MTSSTDATRAYVEQRWEQSILPALRDLLLIAGVATWVETLEELEELVPAYSEWQRRVGRFIKYAL